MISPVKDHSDLTFPVTWESEQLHENLFISVLRFALPFMVTLYGYTRLLTVTSLSAYTRAPWVGICVALTDKLESGAPFSVVVSNPVFTSMLTPARELLSRPNLTSPMCSENTVATNWAVSPSITVEGPDR